MRSHRPKLSERQQLSRRRRRALSVASSVLVATLLGSWVSLHAWSEDALPGWLRAPSDAVAALAALLPGASADSATPVVGARRAAAPPAAAAPTAARARNAIASATAAAQIPGLDSAGGDSATEGPRTSNAETTAAADAGTSAQPSQPLIDPGQPVDPTAPGPGAIVPTPDDVAPILDGVGDTIGDVIGSLLPDDFSLDLSPGVGNENVGTGANADVQLGGESGVQGQVGVEVDTPVTPVDVDGQVSLTGGNAQVALGIGTALGNTTIGVNPTSEAVAQVDLAGVGVAASVPVSGSPASVDLGVNLLGVEIDQPIHIGGDGKGGPLIELPNLGIGLLNSP